MKHIIILGDGMADHPVERLGGKTLLQYAKKPYMDMLAKKGKTGRLVTVPDGFHPGSEVANSSIMGYDQNEVYEGRGPLEAASIGYELEPTDLALRCNIINVQDGKIITHNGGNLETEDADVLIKYLNDTLGKKYPDVKFVTGIQYRHLLVVKHGNKHIDCAPPHDHPNEEWHKLMVKPILPEIGGDEGHISRRDTADLLNQLILESQELLENHPFNVARKERGERMANLIWPWGGGYRPHMLTLSQMYPQIKKGSVISAVDLIRGIGHYAGLRNIIVEGATGLANTNYEGKAAAAIQALKDGDDFVYVHVEASDEAGHDGDLELKLKTIENLDQRLIKPIFDEVSTWDDRGLWGSVRINRDDVDAMSLYARVQRGDVDQCSFGFAIKRETFVDLGNGNYRWEIEEVDPLYEVSVCTFPAYESTSVSARRQDLAEIQKRRAEAWREEMTKKLGGKS